MFPLPLRDLPSFGRKLTQACLLIKESTTVGPVTEVKECLAINVSGCELPAYLLLPLSDFWFLMRFKNGVLFIAQLGGRDLDSE